MTSCVTAGTQPSEPPVRGGSIRVWCMDFVIEKRESHKVCLCSCEENDYYLPSVFNYWNEY